MATPTKRVLSNLKLLSPAVRQSTIGDFQTCPRRFMFRHRFGLRPKYAIEARPLTVGSVYHSLMKGYYLGVPEDRTLGLAQAVIETEIAERRKIEEERGLPEGMVYADDLAVFRERDLALARVCFRAFINKYPFDHDRYETLLLEEAITLEEDFLPVELQGTIDHLIYDKKIDEIIVVDHKTTGRLSPIDRAKVTRNEWQPKLYRYLAAKFLGKRIHKFRHNIIAKPTIEFGRNDRDFRLVERVLTRKCKAGEKGDTVIEKEWYGEPKFENYLKRVMDWFNATGDYAHLEDKWNNSPRIYLSEITFTGHAMTDELKYITQQVGAASKCKIELPQFPKNPGSCNAYGRLCEFLPLCTSNPVTWPTTCDDIYDVGIKMEQAQEESDESD